MRLRSLSAVVTLIASLAWPFTASAFDQLHLPAEREPVAPLVIHAALDLPYVRPLLEDFHRRNPQYDITYRNFATLELDERFLAAPDEADLMISSAMPWQYRLANDGYAQAVDTPVTRRWPAEAKWRQELFAFSFEPVIMVVNRAVIERYGPVDSHADLLDLLRRHGDELRGKVVTYDPVASGAGYTYAIEESRLSPQYWDLIAALGHADAALVNTTGAMMEGLKDGRYLIGYNLLGSYVRQDIDAHPDLEWRIPDDYALVIQRLAFVPRQAPHPINAKHFLDYLLSVNGQGILAKEGHLGALHPELDGPGTANALYRLRPEGLRPTPLGPGLLTTLDDLKRRALLSRWQREFSGPQTLFP